MKKSNLIKIDPSSAITIILSYVIAIISSAILGNTVLYTVCNAIFGAESENSLFVTEILMRLLIPIVAFVILFIIKIRNDDGYHKYTSQRDKISYSAKNDAVEIMHDPFFWGEFTLVSVVTILFWVIYMFHPIFGWALVNIPLFFAYNLFAYMYQHKKWLKRRAEFTHTN